MLKLQQSNKLKLIGFKIFNLLDFDTFASKKESNINILLVNPS